MIQSLNASEILDTQQKISTATIVDVRSPSEYSDAHIPTAINFALFDDNERAQVGTLYKKNGPEMARAQALEIVQPKLSAICENLFQILPTQDQLEEIFNTISKHLILEDDDKPSVKMVLPEHQLQKPVSKTNKDKTFIFYCWRGGARSKSMALLSSLLGFNTYYIDGGHKAFRREVLKYLESGNYAFKLCTLYGLTGSGKTQILRKWKEQGHAVIDLEHLASHRGSAFGQMGIQNQGKQAQFENSLYYEMKKWQQKQVPKIIIEGESRRIGYCQLSEAFMKAMDDGMHVKLEASIEERVKNIVNEYTKDMTEEELQAGSLRALKAIEKKLGGVKFKELKLLLQDRNYPQFTRELLIHYYDKYYVNSRHDDSYYDLVVRAEAIDRQSLLQSWALF